MKPVSRAEAGQTLAEVLHARLKLPFNSVVRLIQHRLVQVNSRSCMDPKLRLRAGDKLIVARPKEEVAKKTPILPAGISAPTIRFLDDHIVVVDKPAGLTTVRHAHEKAEYGSRARRFLPPTLADLLPDLLQVRTGKRKQVFAVHRLDKDTSGLIVFALTKKAEGQLGKQFRAHTVQRSYLALVRGRAENRRVESYFVEDRGDHRRGSSTDASRGKRAITHIEVEEPLGDFTLVRCRLETGRTHQVRIHLGECGWPICGETIYDRPLHGQPVPDPSQAPRLALHAATLEIEHPVTREAMTWESKLPDDIFKLVRRCRKASRD